MKTQNNLPPLPPLIDILNAVGGNSKKTSSEETDYKKENTSLRKLVEELKDRLDSQERKIRVLEAIKEEELSTPPEEHNYHCTIGDCDISVFMRKTPFQRYNKVVCPHFRFISSPECMEVGYRTCQYALLGD